MLVLKRMQYFNEYMKCHASGNILMYGDFYYEDTEDGTIISAKHYHKLKKDRIEENWDYSTLQEAENDKDYEKELKKLEEEYLSQRILDDYDVAGKPIFNKERKFN